MIGTGICIPSDRIGGVGMSFMPMVIFVGYKVVRTFLYMSQIGPGNRLKSFVLCLGESDVIFLI